MSYQVLARKWRPRFFDEMVGQEHVLKALINALNEQRLHHAYLFTGTRGVGKTTIARILAKCLNCEQGISARPCGECSACREIAEGRFVDLIEVDAASRTKVEDTRELLDNVQYAPSRGRFKVYLIDEVHMLSTHSFNALLKTLEEPPAHVKFLLATTDPQKLPVTVLSRCLQFSLKNMTPERIVSYLGKVLEAEKIGYEEPALWQLGRAAQGSMRDALSLTDQAIAYGEGLVGEAQVNAMLGTMDRGRLFKMAEVMARADAAEVMNEVAAMAEHGPDYDEVLQGLLTIWHRAALGQVVPDAIENSQGDREAILQLAMAMQPEDLQLYYQIALNGRADLALAPDPRQGFEMILLRMLAFRPAPAAPLELDLDLESALQKKKRLSSDSLSNLSSDVAEAPTVVSATPAEPVEPTPADVPDISTVSALADELSSDDGVSADIEAPDHAINALADSIAGEALVDASADVPEAGITEQAAGFATNDQLLVSEQMVSGSDNNAAIADLPADRQQYTQTAALAEEHLPPAVAVVEPTPEPESLPADEPVAPVSQDDTAPTPYTWWQWVNKLKLAGLPMAIARNSALVQVDGDRYIFDVDPVQGALFNDGQRLRIQDAMREWLPQAVVEMTLQLPRGETPEQRRQREAAEAHYGAKQAIEADPLVQRVLAEFGGFVVDDSIRPVS
ncbi:DNA polymerase III subunit gamma/tau [Thalassolituus sp. ST750PaO-4]|uniref:DNA polymerase III subunit gamma/tau n=1 Tax=Thalassolituus sp. ST750PaO-4 TaxID=2742965 RepID=UPI001CE284A3|nr:DNA polymerase III subunit gamma/tau [Thalassolituus sp. ST750PaO-4]MCA6061133.1 DNA polymerase III subunit gamma/tau [Thalassolituus sp. ST750PaO-4]